MDKRNNSTGKTCSVEGCDDAIDRRGFCCRHYSRWYRHGCPLFTKQKAPIDKESFIKNGIGYIELTKGKYAMVDQEDFNLVKSISWCLSSHGYARNTTIRTSMHRFILQPEDNQHVDHINGNTLDNRRSNLRISTREQNMWNSVKHQRGKVTSKYKGVWYRSDRKKWTSQIRANGKVYFIGDFDNEHEAALAWNNKSMKLHGEYAKLNHVDTSPQA